jgi:hypothetical protein
LAVESGDTRRAVRLYGATQAGFTTIGMVPPPYYRAECEAGLAAARAILTEAEFAAAYRDGLHLSLDDAVSYARLGDKP